MDGYENVNNDKTFQLKVKRNAFHLLKTGKYFEF